MDGEELDVKGAFSSLQSGRKKDTMGEKARPFPALGKGRILRQGVCFMARRTQAVIMQAFMTFSSAVLISLAVISYILL